MEIVKHTGISFAMLLIALKLSAYEACATGAANGSEKCCTNYIKVNNTCQDCPAGYFGENCSSPCNYPAYGFRCLSNCSCSSSGCHHQHGCVFTTEHPLEQETKIKSPNECAIGETSEHRQCCTNYFRTDNMCQECPIGHFGDNCTSTCIYPSFGSTCREQCNCPIVACDYKYGCRLVTEIPEVLPTTGSTPHHVPQTGTEMVQTIVTSESGNSSTNFDSGSNVLPIGIIIGIGSLTVFVLLMIIMHAFLKYLRGISTVQNVTEASGDVYMEISDNMILGQGGVSNESNVREDRAMSVIEQSGSCSNGLASAEERITDYVYSEVGKKPMHEKACNYKPIKSEDPKMNFSDNPDTYYESSEIQKMDESDQSGFLDDTPPVHIVNVVNNAEETMTDYVYSEVNKKQCTS